MKQWKIWTALILVFISGLAIGAVGSTIITHLRVQHLFESRPKFSEEHLMQHFMDQLDLTSEERKKTKTIFEHLANDLKMFHVENNPRVTAIFEKTKKDLKKCLPSTKHAQIDEIMHPPSTPPFPGPPPPPPF